MRSIRILFISNFYPPHDLGGWEQNCQEVVQRLTERGHVCHVITSRFGVQGPPPPELNVTRTLHLESDIYYYHPLDFFLRRPGQERANRAALRTALDAFHPDMIFIWGLWNLSWQVAYWAEQWLPGRVAHAVAGYWLLSPNAHESYWQRMPRSIWTRMLMAPARWQARRILTKKRTQFPLTLSHVAFVSQYVRQKHQQAGIRPPDARVIYNGIDPYPFLPAAQRRKPAPDALRLLYIGGLTPAKGVHVAIEALGVLKRSEELNNLSLRIVGGGQPDYENKLRQRVVDLGLEAYVTFQGREPRRKIPAIMAEHDVLLFTSIYEEPIARTVMEGMAAGLAVIATAVGGQAEMLEDGANALVTPPGDVNALATTIVRLKRDTGLRRHLATAGRKTIQTHFTLKRMVDEIEAWLQEIVV